MHEAPSESREHRPADPDLHWTGWALDTLRELVSIDMRTKRMTETQQLRQGAVGPDAPDFDLKQSRLSRSVRLSLAMTERIRADYLLRKDERVESGEQERRRKLRGQVAEAAVKAVAAPDKDWDADYVRSAVREKLNEDDVLDAKLDLLSPEAFLREVCRKIGRPPPSIPLPSGFDGPEGPDEGANDNSGLSGTGRVDAGAQAGEGSAEPPEEPGDGPPSLRLPLPDSS